MVMMMVVVVVMIMIMVVMIVLVVVVVLLLLMVVVVMMPNSFAKLFLPNSFKSPLNSPKYIFFNTGSAPVLIHARLQSRYRWGHLVTGD